MLVAQLFVAAAVLVSSGAIVLLVRRRRNAELGELAEPEARVYASAIRFCPVDAEELVRAVGEGHAEHEHCAHRRAPT